jgi:beta-glucosidase
MLAFLPGLQADDKTDAGRNYGSGATAKPQEFIYPPSYDDCMKSGQPVITRQPIYHEGWIDLNKNGQKDIYEDPQQPVEKRLDDLIRQMNLNEKTCQLVTLYGYARVCPEYLPAPSWKTTAIQKDGIANIDEHLNGFYYFKDKKPGGEFIWPASKHAWALNEVQRFFIEETRLGIPVDFTNEGIRGIEHVRSTDFPTPLAMGCAWDRDLVRKMGEVGGSEALALGYTNMYGPIMDVMRDPRWGRCEESFGECPFLCSELGIQEVLGIQSQRVVSTLKHFCIYADNKGARENSSRCDPQCGWREAEQIHLWPFERVIQGANPLGIMSSYNDYNGEPIQSSSYYLTEILRTRMGFKGYVVSDSSAVEWLSGKHRTAKNQKDSVRQSVLAGLNVRTNFSKAEDYVLPLRELVNEGTVPMSVIDARVRDVLRVKFWQGRFDAPYRPLKEADAVILKPEHIALAKRAALESLVLLKNDGAVLPLDIAKIKTIAVCGPNADDPGYALGHYGALDVPVSTVLKAMQERGAAKGIKVLYAKGCERLGKNETRNEIMWEPPTDAEQKGIDEAAGLARQADATVVVVGDKSYGGDQDATSGENRSRISINLTGRQDDLIRAVAAAAAGKPVIIIHISGRPNSINWANRLCPAIIQAFAPGMEGGRAIVEVLFGDYNPGGKLSCTVAKTTGQLKLNFPALPSANEDFTPLNDPSPLWSFGHGLSYTDFAFADLEISWPGKAEKRLPTIADSITVACNVTNAGKRDGDEVVQLYTRDLVSSVMTYDKNLRGFERIQLKAGETKRVTFTITPDLLTLWNHDRQRVVEPGEFQVMVGNSSVDLPRDKKTRKVTDPQAPGIKLTGKFEMVALPEPAKK